MKLEVSSILGEYKRFPVVPHCIFCRDTQDSTGPGNAFRYSSETLSSTETLSGSICHVGAQFREFMLPRGNGVTHSLTLRTITGMLNAFLSCCMKMIWMIGLLSYVCFLSVTSVVAEDAAKWKYAPKLLTPFWQDDIVRGESVLFIKDPASGLAKGRLLFPVEDILEVRDSSGEVLYEQGVDYQFQSGGTTVTLPAASQIVAVTPDALRRPADSQPHKLTHRDGSGEILFGAKLEYHQMQTMVTYKKASSVWPASIPTYQPELLPKSIAKLQSGEPLSIVLLGDSISTGCNASAWGEGPPFQPAFQDLLAQHLKMHYQTEVSLTNLSVGGMTAAWGVTMVDKVAELKPDLVILAFGMNDAAGRPAADYGRDTQSMIQSIRQELPETEFILVATMLGNQDWPRLDQDLFLQFRAELDGMVEPGIALADMTSIWEEMLRRKNDSDLTGNGVNHPNDFGHRVYAQVLSAILIP